MSSNNNNDEVQRAQAVAAAGGIPNNDNDDDDTAPLTLFDKIVAGQIPCNKLYEDDVCLAFFDVNPQAPTHFLVIPKVRHGLTQLSNMKESQKELVGHLMYVAQQLGKQQCPKGFRLVINDGPDGAQSVYHLHIHVVGGRQMLWPPG
jgi:histidine triad (HIT) family protein